MTCCSTTKGPCKLIAPKFKTFAAENPDVTYAKIDVDDVAVSISLEETRMMHEGHVLIKGRDVKIGRRC